MASVVTDLGHGVTVAAMLGGTEPKYIGWGTGAGTATSADTTLFSEKDTDLTTGTGTRTTGTSSQVTTTYTGDTYQVVGTRAATGSGTVTNAGLFTNATIASGTMFVKSDSASWSTGSIALLSGDTISFTFKIKQA